MYEVHRRFKRGLAEGTRGYALARAWVIKGAKWPDQKDIMKVAHAAGWRGQVKSKKRKQEKGTQKYGKWTCASS